MKKRGALGVLLPHVGIYGGVRHFIDLGNVFVDRGYSYALFTPEGRSPAWMAFRGETRSLQDLAGSTLDVLLCGDSGSELLQIFVSTPARLKVLWLFGKRYASKYQAFLESIQGKVSNLVIVGNGSDWKDYLPAFVNHPAFTAYTVPGGVDLSHFQPQPDASLRSSEPFRVLTVGSPQKKRKGVFHVIRAFERFHDRQSFPRPAMELVIVANKKAHLPYFHWGAHQIYHFLWGQGKRERIRLVSEVSNADLPYLYHQAHMVVSAEEDKAGWNNPVGEAMACKVPVICTRAGTADLASHLETAWVVPFGDWKEIAVGLERLYRDKTLREKLLEQAYENVRKFSWDAVADHLEIIFQEQALG